MPALWPSGWEPRVVAREIAYRFGDAPKWRVETPGAVDDRGRRVGLGRYFPDVAQEELDQYEYPEPLSEEFWRQYAEPLDDFVAAVERLRHIVEGLALPVKERDDDLSFVKAQRELNVVLSGVCPVLVERKSGAFSQRRAAVSLLSHMGLVLLEELTAEGRRPLRCTRCGALFLSRAYQARFCSQRCRWRAQKVRQRSSRARRPKGRKRTPPPT